MDHPAGESYEGSLRADFGRRLKLEFHGSRPTSGASILVYRELDDALGLTDLAGSVLSESRRSKNTRHLNCLLRQSRSPASRVTRTSTTLNVSRTIRRCAP